MIKPTGLNLQPMSPCLKLFIEYLMAENGAEISIEQFVLDDEPVVESAIFASDAPMTSDKSYN